MKQKIIFFTLVVLFAALQGSSQDRQLRYSSVNTFGVLNGGMGGEWQVQTVQGIRYKTLYAGIGAGIDNYFRKTIPVFLDLRKNIFEREKTPFFYLDLGSSFPFKKHESGSSWTGSYTSTFKKGYYYDAGIGYSIPIRGRFAAVISLGYSQKYMEEEQAFTTYPYDSRIYAPWMHTSDHYTYTLRRFSLRTGISF
jgi:hypothetical protein